jgi:DJ-1/PfpI family
MALKDKRILFLLGPQYQDEEGAKPYEFLKDKGALVDVVGLEKGPLKGLHGRAEIEVTKTIEEADPADYDAMIIPGGRCASTPRRLSWYVLSSKPERRLPPSATGPRCWPPPGSSRERPSPGTTR